MAADPLGHESRKVTTSRLDASTLTAMQSRIQAAKETAGPARVKTATAKLAQLESFYGASRLSELHPAFCASYVRDVLQVLRPEAEVQIDPEFGAQGVLQAAILPMATAHSLDLIRANVPAELVNLPAWVASSRRPRANKAGVFKSCKVPLSPVTGAEARSNDPMTWSNFEAAASFALQGVNCLGVGINLLNSPFLGLDLDHVINQDGNLDPAAVELLENLPATYTEVSPSGTGLRLFFRGSKPPALRASARKDAFGPGKALEVYDGKSGARYLTVTGKVWGGATKPIANVDEKDLAPLVRAFERGAVEQSLPPATAASERKAEHPTMPALATVPPTPFDLARARWGLLEARLLDPDAGYERWLRVLVALKPFGDAGLELAVSWSKPSRDFDRAEIEAKWPGLKGSSVASLFGMFNDQFPGWQTEFAKQTAEGRSEDGELLVLNKARTLPTATKFVHQFYTDSGQRTLVCQGGQFFAWNGSCYRPVEDGTLRNVLQPWLDKALTQQGRGAEGKLVPFPANSSTITQALDAIRDLVHMPTTTPNPSWLTKPTNDPNPAQVLSCATKLLHLPTGRELAPTPRYFNTSALDFDYDQRAPSPVRWLAFLDEVFSGRAEEIKLLQQWCGYVLTPDTSQQKLLLLVGPRRSGKGTLARVLHKLLGEQNVVGPTTSSLASQFGLQPLIGKSLAIISDARFRGEGVNTVVERLLCISGEDAITIDRKYLGSITLTLPTRFMIISNEMPILHDSSQALSGRFLPLQLTNSFYGKEDRNLLAKLAEELPGILNWAIEGWRSLQDAGRFVTPSSSEDFANEVDQLMSPIRRFVNACCHVEPAQRATAEELYSAWLYWGTSEGRYRSIDRQAFLRDLKSLLPQLTRHRGTGNDPFYSGIGIKPQPE